MQKEPVNYVDAIVVASRRLAADLAMGRAWIARADATTSASWRLSFLTEARRAQDAAARELARLDEHLATLGKNAPPPLDRIVEKSAGMAKELRALTANIGRRERESPALGDA